MSKASKALKRRGVGVVVDVHSHHFAAPTNARRGLRAYQQDALDLVKRSGMSPYLSIANMEPFLSIANLGKTTVPGVGSKYLHGGVIPSINYDGEWTFTYFVNGERKIDEVDQAEHGSNRTYSKATVAKQAMRDLIEKLRAEENANR